MTSKFRNLLSNDAVIFGLIFLGGLLYTLPVTPALEFFRHTEADRTLLGWEMYQNGNFAIPHLLGDQYLTKPPLYYWALAAAFAVIGEPLEWAARSISGLSAALLLAFFFLFLRQVGWQRPFALLSTAILGASAQFFQYSIKAEIDMLYSLLCGLALFVGYLSFIRPRRLNCILLASILVGLSLLTKGPPVLIFYGSGIFFFSLYQLVTTDKHQRRKVLGQFLLLHSFGAVVFCSIVAIWILAVLQSVPWSDLKFLFQDQIIQRFIADTNATLRAKPFYFYLVKIIAGLLPWSCLALGYVLPLKQNIDQSPQPEISLTQKNSLIFALCVIVPTICIFSLSSGKSGRYLFPIYPFLAYLLAYGSTLLRGSQLERWLWWLCRLTCFAAAIGAIVMVYYFWHKIPIFALLASAFTILLAFAPLYFGTRNTPEKKRISLLCYFTLALVALRIPYALVYAPLANQEKSVKPIAQAIEQVLTAAEPLYLLELFERWIPYYLVRQGRSVFRLTPELAAKLSSQHDSKIHILINKAEEHWRLKQVEIYDPSMQVVRTFYTSKDEYLLVQVRSDMAHYFKPKKIYPTVPSKPTRLTRNGHD
ncbi:hypothetical protein OAO01_00825 [Oligoflexia bacterium]|nr:hypothetical protein [Oligoflexia bacterium]